VRLAALALATVGLALPGAAGAAEKSGVDRGAGVKLTLAGRTLTAQLHRPGRIRVVPDSTEPALFGERILGACGSTVRSTKRGVVWRERVWPDGARSAVFRFARDISRRAKWCLIEHDGADIAFVSFIGRDRIRLVGKGRGPSGAWWRLGGGSGPLAEPCALLRIRGLSTWTCYDQFRGRPVTLGAEHWAPCGGDTYTFGVAAARTAAVRLTLADGGAADANVFDPAPGSRVRARFFAAALPEGTRVREAIALDATGTRLGRRRLPQFPSAPCG
jgi:hypothetical protein